MFIHCNLKTIFVCVFSLVVGISLFIRCGCYLHNTVGIDLVAI